jgi:hypothetical protein
MSKLKPRRPSAAMIVALLALFVALGGSAVASGLLNGHHIKKNSIPLNRLTRAARIATVNPPANGPGQPGPEGREGKPGTNGSNGVEGKVGPEGKAGEKGSTGSPGSQGPQGEKGDNGSPGAPGSPGSPGTPGAPGAPGAPGSPGQPGPEGPQGPQGEKGETGTQGPQGPQGQPGMNAGEPQVVTASALDGWVLATYGDNSETSEPGYPNGRGSEPANVANGTLEFATPSVAPSLGTKSLKITTTAGHPVVAYPPLPPGNAPLLSELTTAGYNSLVTASSSEFNDVSLQIEVVESKATHFSSGYTTVVYEPYQNGENTVVGEWHHHVVAAGGQRSGLVWSTQALPSGECSQNAPCALSKFIEQNPEAVVLDAKLRIGQNSGTGWSGFEAYVDDVRLGFGEYNRYDLGG